MVSKETDLYKLASLLISFCECYYSVTRAMTDETALDCRTALNVLYIMEDIVLNSLVATLEK